jgi:hypothetical protein
MHLLNKKLLRNNLEYKGKNTKTLIFSREPLP